MLAGDTAAAWQNPTLARDVNGDGQVSSIDALIRQVSAPVRWEDCVRRLASAGVTAYVEVGPGTVLSGLVKKIAREAVILNLDAPEGLAPIEALAASGSAHA